ncbi:hypothetical protein THAOC_12733 [Thalassiosira oceanica]|uniref:Uncharacterized protein n=1 Tax=Thalassiosira oceanica TaxID=159749 RepID=K0T7B9_THAOC|nr:hypothetical protein THAOC_12733 [Thalassiosira oceanica]|eukprot:EJK66357.1 hypothetical protein THAOC_12733 [Thalassiosira oceanica]
MPARISCWTCEKAVITSHGGHGPRCDVLVTKRPWPSGEQSGAWIVMLGFGRQPPCHACLTRRDDEGARPGFPLSQVPQTAPDVFSLFKTPNGSISSICRTREQRHPYRRPRLSLNDGMEKADIQQSVRILVNKRTVSAARLVSHMTMREVCNLEIHRPPFETEKRALIDHTE